MKNYKYRHVTNLDDDLPNSNMKVKIKGSDETIGVKIGGERDKLGGIEEKRRPPEERLINSTITIKGMIKGSNDVIDMKIAGEREKSQGGGTERKRKKRSY